MRILSNRITLAALAALLSVGTASAATITQTFTQPLAPTTWSFSNIPFNQFDPALGTLNSVTLQFAGSFSQTELIAVPGGRTVAVAQQFDGGGRCVHFWSAEFHKSDCGHEQIEERDFVPGRDHCGKDLADVQRVREPELSAYGAVADRSLHRNRYGVLLDGGHGRIPPRPPRCR